VQLHLIAQGLEVWLKATLLRRDYGHYQPLLKKFGHNLVWLAEESAKVHGLPPLRCALVAELSRLNAYYSNHLLRYATPLDLVVDPTTIECEHVLRRYLAAVRIIGRGSAAGEAVHLDERLDVGAHTGG